MLLIFILLISILSFVLSIGILKKIRNHRKEVVEKVSGELYSFKEKAGMYAKKTGSTIGDILKRYGPSMSKGLRDVLSALYNYVKGASYLLLYTKSEAFREYVRERRIFESIERYRSALMKYIEEGKVPKSKIKDVIEQLYALELLAIRYLPR